MLDAVGEGAEATGELFGGKDGFGVGAHVLVTHVVEAGSVLGSVLRGWVSD